MYKGKALGALVVDESFKTRAALFPKIWRCSSVSHRSQR